MTRRVRLKIKGLVQGVFYRAEAREQAQALGVKGYARNDRDGSVTVVGVGDDTALLKLIEWCKRGPQGARVDNVEIAYENPVEDETFTGFDIH